MKDREKIIRYFAATSDDAKDMAIRLLDLADVVDRGRPFAVGPFMSPFAAQIGQTIATHMKTVTVKSEGGYHEAERVRIAFSTEIIIHNLGTFVNVYLKMLGKECFLGLSETGMFIPEK